MNSQSPPKGSLEELFRHHLRESEAAAVPPRPLVWEHIDNSLLLAQNEKYRRRLLAYRWGMAASLLLAALGGGGWWHSQQGAPATLASAHPQSSAAQAAVANATTASRRALPPASQPTSQDAAPGPSLASSTTLPPRQPLNHAGASTAANANTAATSAAAQRGTSRGPHSGSAGLLATTQPEPGGRFAAPAGAAGQRALAFGGPSSHLAAAQRPQQGVGLASQTALANANAHTVAFSSITTAEPIGTTATSLSAGSFGFSAASRERPREAAFAASRAESTFAAAALPSERTARTTDSRESEALLATHQVLPALAPAEALPSNLTLKEVAPLPATELRRWRFGVEYAASAFNPNIDFNRGSATYNMALGFNTVSATRSAAAEYRANLRAGLGQRLGLRATRWLSGHWSLSTGIELAQQDAQSATSSGFVGEQQADLTNSPTAVYVPRELRTSSYRYRSAGVPVELRYDNQAKAGLSFYGRVGAIVSALLSVRSEVASNPEATRTYSFFSASTPYRRLTTLLRGSAGVRYRPANSTWGVSVGPTAEAGVQSMNAETDKSFLQQNRPYSFGLEAGFEFGGTLKPVEDATR